MTKKKKKIPLRLCIGCQEKKPKKELVRIVKTPENEIKLDSSGKMNGRGVYLCKDEACFDEAFKKNKFQKSFQKEIKNHDREEIKKYFFEILQ